jgi:hypothetical protein
LPDRPWGEQAEYDEVAGFLKENGVFSSAGYLSFGRVPLRTERPTGDGPAGQRHPKALPLEKWGRWLAKV